jgi:hypothetical protein
MTILPQARRCTSFEEFKLFMSSSANQSADFETFEAKLLDAETFTVPGYCAVCDREASFFVDHLYCFTAPDKRRIPNWRERLVCPHCNLNNRMRAAAGFLLSVSRPDNAVYLTEFVTPLFRVIVSKRKRTIGSEYLRNGTERGTTNTAGVRHEDVTCLNISRRSLRRHRHVRRAGARPGLSAGAGRILPLPAASRHVDNHGAV